ncbi:MAG: sugar ABC transporter ATP-binding protein [Rhizobiaceae bacterium]
MSQSAAIAVHGASKRFAATQALRDVSLAIRPGEVVALMGANGAGKSTLVKILAGALTPDSGSLSVGGQTVRIASPQQAKQLGIATVHQQTEQAGCAGLTVAENLLLEEFCGSQGRTFVGPRRTRARAAAMLAAVDVRLPLDADFSDLSPAEKQLVAIARAASARARVLILDEPTSTLSASEAERLFALIERVRAEGMAVLYISHRIGDLRRLADRAIVLRGGALVAEYARPIDFQAAIGAMIGHAVQHRARAAEHAAEPCFSARGVKLRPDAAAFDLDVGRGEVVAITGALGAGKSRLLRSIFGTEKLAAGSMALEGSDWKSSGPAASIHAGVFMVAEDRWRSSLFPDTTLSGTIAGTIAFPHLKRWFPSGFVRRRRQHAVAADSIRDLGIRARGPADTLDQLSGGNQQKVVLARWQAAPCRLLLLDEPFQGVDVGARADLIAAIRRRPDGSGVLIATSDAEEALEVADRIFVMRDHTLIASGYEAGGDSLLSVLGSVEAAAAAEG